MEGKQMKRTRRMALAVAVPIVALALGGAAKDPTLTYHGVFDGGDLTGTCSMLFPKDAWSGIWNLQVRSTDGSPLGVKVTLKYEGRPHAVWRLPFNNLEPGIGFLAKGERIPIPGMDEAKVSLKSDGVFIYHLMLDFPDDPDTPEPDPFDCDAHFAGHLTN
jgi:hypothetical protein